LVQVAAADGVADAAASVLLDPQALSSATAATAIAPN
jgi:hypothetical protein